jgi:diguanylate cyclase (GGDEF)-like protein
VTGALKVLVVHDYAADRDAVRQVFDELEAGVVEAGSVSGALAAARACEFALFVVDVRVAIASGCKLAVALRREARAEDVPILFLTTDAWEGQHGAEAAGLAPVDFMPAAPLDAVTLQHKSSMFLEIQQARNELRANIARLESENHALRSQRDEFVREREHLVQQCTHDELTALPNRSLFDDRLQGAVQRARHLNRKFALIYLDLDDFKVINDQHGHAIGDEVLLVVGRRLAQGLRGSDTVARLGGDEFAALVENIDSADTAVRAGESMRSLIMAPIVLESQRGSGLGRLRLTASAGVVIYPDDSTRPEDLLELGDRAMYAAKRAGGGVRLASSRAGGLRLVESIKTR